MRQFKKITLLLLCTMAFPLFGNNYCCPNPCDIDCCNPCESDCSEFYIGGEIKVWKPCFRDMHYAVNICADLDADIDLPNSVDVSLCSKGKIKYVCHDFEPGFRIYGGVNNLFCNWGLEASYTRITNETSSSTCSNLDNGCFALSTLHSLRWTGLIFSDKIKARHCFEYQSFDVLLKRPIHTDCCGTFTALVGIEGLKVDQEIKTCFGLTLVDILTENAFAQTQSLDNLRELVSKDCHDGCQDECKTKCIDQDNVGAVRGCSELEAIGLKAGFDWNYSLSSCGKYFFVTISYIK